MKNVNEHGKSMLSNQRTALVPLFFVMAVSLLLAPSAEAVDDALCIPVQAKIEAFFVVEGCESPVGLCTAGTITRGGFLDGTTSFTALATAEGAGLPGGIEPLSTLSYTGILEVAAAHGTLTLSDVGVLDPETGVFSELDRITDGTGKFEGASGVLFIYGNTTAGGTGFIGTIKGEVCLVQ